MTSILGTKNRKETTLVGDTRPNSVSQLQQPIHVSDVLQSCAPQRGAQHSMMEASCENRFEYLSPERRIVFMPHALRTIDVHPWKPGDRFSATLANGATVTAVWGGCARYETLLKKWLYTPGNELAQGPHVSEVAITDEETGKTRWGPAPSGAGLLFVLLPVITGKDGREYRLGKLVTTEATPEELAYFRDNRVALFGTLTPDGKIQVIPPVSPPPPDAPMPVQGELF